MTPVALTIAGSDPSGGAGIQADLKTFHRFGVYGEAAITLLTVQNSQGVQRVELVDAALVVEQVVAAIEDIRPQAAKTGALGSAETVRAIAGLRFDCPLVVDPVMVSKHGVLLASGSAVESMRRELMPKAALVTPNLEEASALTDRTIATIEQMRDAARALCDMGARAALVKGGHLERAPVDVLFCNGIFHEFSGERMETRHTHGTGCTLSAAIAAGLARGSDLVAAVAEAKAFVTRAIRGNPGLGGGYGPLNHWA